MSRAKRKPGLVDRPAMQRAVKDFLVAAGVDPKDPNLVATPQRVTEAWADEFLTGYAQSPKEALGEVFQLVRPADRELVVVSDLRFRSMCPHHLLPVSGRAHIAYLPGKSVVGFGRLSALLDTFAHRLILQEDLARAVARALVEHLGCKGAACILAAEQMCLRLRGGVQHDAITHAEAYEGALKQKALRAELWARLGAKE